MRDIYGSLVIPLSIIVILNVALFILIRTRVLQKAGFCQKFDYRIACSNLDSSYMHRSCEREKNILYPLYGDMREACVRREGPLSLY